MRACHLHQGLDLIAVPHRNQLQWAKVHLRWPLARCRSVLFTDDSRFQLYWADDRQRVWRRVGEMFVDVYVVNIVPLGGGGDYGIGRQ